MNHFEVCNIDIIFLKLFGVLLPQVLHAEQPWCHVWSGLIKRPWKSTALCYVVQRGGGREGDNKIQQSSCKSSARVLYYNNRFYSHGYAVIAKLCKYIPPPPCPAILLLPLSLHDLFLLVHHFQDCWFLCLVGRETTVSWVTRGQMT